MAEQAHGRRRLAAIVSADVVGYTRVMGADEAATLRRTSRRGCSAQPMCYRLLTGSDALWETSVETGEVLRWAVGL